MTPTNQKRAQQLLNEGRTIDEVARIIAKENNKTDHANKAIYWRNAIIDAVWLGKLRV